MTLTVRSETVADAEAVHRLNVAAFDREPEARLVDALRAAGALILSLVAEDAEGVLGHIAFSEVTVTRPDGRVVTGVGLAPLAVAPARQRTGIGERLVTEGLRRLRAGGHRFCIVLGHPAYYPRFGFAPASRFGLRWEKNAPDEAFMACALVPGGLDGVSGVVRYRPELEAV